MLGLLSTFSCRQNVFNLNEESRAEIDDSRAQLLDGQKFLRDGDPKEAYRAFNQAIRLDSSLGEARLGASQAALDLHGLSPVEFIDLARESSSGNAGFQKMWELFQKDAPTLNALYLPLHLVVLHLTPLFDGSFQLESGDFQSQWIATDFALILTAHTFLTIMDLNSDGRIDDKDSPLRGLDIVRSDTADWSLEGLQPVLENDSLKEMWTAKVDTLLADIPLATLVFKQALGEDSPDAQKVDSLLNSLSDALKPYRKEED